MSYRPNPEITFSRTKLGTFFGLWYFITVKHNCTEVTVYVWALKKRRDLITVTIWSDFK